MLESYNVKSEKIGFRDGLTRAPNLTFLHDDKEVATVEFNGQSLFKFASNDSSLAGRCGLISNNNSSKEWYVSIYDQESREKRAEALSIRPIGESCGVTVVSISSFEACDWEFSSEVLKVTKSNGEIVGQRTALDNDTGYYCKVELLDRLGPTNRDYLLIMLTLLAKPLPWFTLAATMGTPSSRYPWN
jgi:hypothetical protein